MSVRLDKRPSQLEANTARDAITVFNRRTPKTHHPSIIAAIHLPQDIVSQRGCCGAYPTSDYNRQPARPALPPTRQPLQITSRSSSNRPPADSRPYGASPSFRTTQPTRPLRPASKPSSLPVQSVPWQSGTGQPRAEHLEQEAENGS